MERSGFFDAHLLNGEYDRVYLAEHFARYFANFIGNGIFGGKSNELMVRQKETADMSVRVLTGQGFINGYFYENTDELSLAIDNADGVLNRIDLIILRWDKYERVIRIAVEKGIPASYPSAPTLKRNDDYFELKLAEVYIKAGATSITQVDITDTRLDSGVCGFVVSTVEHIDTTEFNAQLNAWIDEFKVDSYAEVDALVKQLEALIENIGDLGPLITDVENLKDLSIESAEYPGCYYRVVSGETEWLNPPNEYGIEYRLTERWQGRPVFQETIFVPSLPSNSHAYIQINNYFEKAISVHGHAYFPDDLALYPFPVLKGTSAVPAAYIQRVEDPPENQSFKGAVGIITTDESMANFSAEIVVKYVKYGI